MLAGMGFLKSTATLEITAILPFTHNRFGRQMDLSKKIRGNKIIHKRWQKGGTNISRVRMQPALCTDLKLEGSMADR